MIVFQLNTSSKAKNGFQIECFQLLLFLINQNLVKKKLITTL